MRSSVYDAAGIGDIAREDDVGAWCALSGWVGTWEEVRWVLGINGYGRNCLSTFVLLLFGRAVITIWTPPSHCCCHSSGD
jgi:hypothetical protein